MKALALGGLLMVSLPAQAQVPCEPYFPLKQDWRGGDGIFSVPLLSGKTLWLFGDSFVLNPYPKEAGPDRSKASLVANSLGVSVCGPEGFEVDYFFRQTEQILQGQRVNAPAAFFVHPGMPQNQKYWPIHGFEHGGKLYLLLEVIETTPGPENGFNFAITGVTVAEIVNYSDHPLRWQIRYRPLSQSRNTLPGIAVVKAEGYLYLLSVREDASKKHPLLLHRVALADLGQDPWPLNYLGEDQQWKPGLDGPDAQILVPEAATEASLHWDAHSQMWIMVHTHPTFFSREVVIRKSPSLTGPWNTAVRQLPLYNEMEPADPAYDPNTFCYAAKAHPAFSQSGELWLSYACNSLDFNTLLRRNDLYRPVMKRLQRPSD